jgi:hypothetical protein
MPSEIVRAAPSLTFMQYDGTNSADILAAIQDVVGSENANIDSESSGHLVVNVYDTGWIQQTINETEWYQIPDGRSYTEAEFSTFIQKS